MIGSTKLLARLRAEHDANMYPPEGWEPRKPEPVVIAFAPVKFGTESISEQFVPMTGKKIVQAVARRFGITTTAICGTCRREPIVTARQVAMYLCRELLPKGKLYRNSYPAIGRIVGGKDHTTVLHGIRKIAGLLPQDENLAFTVAVLIEELIGAQG
jgi:chromosomal replication initiator protein